MVSVFLRSRYFSSKTNARAFLRNLVRNDLNPKEDYDWLVKVVQEYYGENVCKLEVVVHPEHECKCVQYTREDGKTGFVSMASLVGYSDPAASHRGRVTGAFRNEVKADIEAFRDRAFKKKKLVLCEMTGEPVTKEDSHIDHVLPFSVLLDEFLKKRDTMFCTIQTEYMNNRHRLRDRRLASDWIEYHTNHAQLRVTNDKANLGRGNRAGPSKTLVGDELSLYRQGMKDYQSPEGQDLLCRFFSLNKEYNDKVSRVDVENVRGKQVFVITYQNGIRRQLGVGKIMKTNKQLPYDLMITKKIHTSATNANLEARVFIWSLVGKIPSNPMRSIFVAIEPIELLTWDRSDRMYSPDPHEEEEDWTEKERLAGTLGMYKEEALIRHHRYRNVRVAAPETLEIYLSVVLFVEQYRETKSDHFTYVKVYPESIGLTTEISHIKRHQVARLLAGRGYGVTNQNPKRSKHAQYVKPETWLWIVHWRQGPDYVEMKWPYNRLKSNDRPCRFMSEKPDVIKDIRSIYIKTSDTKRRKI